MNPWNMFTLRLTLMRRAIMKRLGRKPSAIIAVYARSRATNAKYPYEPYRPGVLDWRRNNDKDEKANGQ